MIVMAIGIGRSEMNEKIRELFEQVADNLDPEDCMVSEEFLEKFAELIVSECLIIAATQTNADKVFKQIQKEFGVKVAKETK